MPLDKLIALVTDVLAQEHDAALVLRDYLIQTTGISFAKGALWYFESGSMIYWSAPYQSDSSSMVVYRF